MNVALALLDEGLALAPQADYLLGAKLELYRERNEPELAKKVLQQIEKTNPNALRLPFYQALISIDAGDWDKATLALKRFDQVRKGPPRPGPSTNLAMCGWIYGEALKKGSAINSDFEKRLLEIAMVFSRQNRVFSGQVAPVDHFDDKENWEKLFLLPGYNKFVAELEAQKSNF